MVIYLMDVVSLWEMLKHQEAGVLLSNLLEMVKQMWLVRDQIGSSGSS